MKKIIFATGNQDKMREIREILADMDVEVVSMKEAGIHADIVENGSTFEENAVIKAKTICELTGEITLADDKRFHNIWFSVRQMVHNNSEASSFSKPLPCVAQIEEPFQCIQFVIQKCISKFTSYFCWLHFS